MLNLLNFLYTEKMHFKHSKAFTVSEISFDINKCAKYMFSVHSITDEQFLVYDNQTTEAVTLATSHFKGQTNTSPLLHSTAVVHSVPKKWHPNIFPYNTCQSTMCCFKSLCNFL